jgi:SAM-dependent methyltransferase
MLPAQRRWFREIMAAVSIALQPGIRRAQQAVAACQPIPHYLTSYREEEARYWLPVASWLRRDFSRSRPPRVLDIGCAYGTLAVYCRQQLDAQVCCTDFRADALSPSLRRRYELDFTASNIETEQLPWSGPFDAILMTEVLEHLNFQPLPSLLKIRQSLAPGGRFYLTTPDADAWGRGENLYPSLDQIPAYHPSLPVLDRHIYLYTQQELESLLHQAGFRILRCGHAPGVSHRHHALTLTIR